MHICLVCDSLPTSNRQRWNRYAHNRHPRSHRAIWLITTTRQIGRTTIGPVTQGACDRHRDEAIRRIADNPWTGGEGTTTEVSRAG